MSGYAKNTKVGIDASIMEIRKIVTRYGATEFSFGEKAGTAVTQFTCEERIVRVSMILPHKNDDRFLYTESGRPRRSLNAIDEAWEQECKRSWRALAMVVKAKLEAVASGITTFDEEFMAHIVMPGGRTVGDTMLPQMRQALTDAALPVRSQG